MIKRLVAGDGGCLRRTNSSSSHVVRTRRPNDNCWKPSPSSKADETKRKKTVGDVDKAAAKPEPGVRKVPDSQMKQFIGKLVDDVSTYEGVAKRAITSTRTLDKLAAQIGADPENEGYTSLTVQKFQAVTAKKAIAMLCEPEGSGDDNNRVYTEEEAKTIVDYLLAQAGRGGKLYVAKWDDISSEWIGSMLAAVKPDAREATFAQVVRFRP